MNLVYAWWAIIGIVGVVVLFTGVARLCKLKQSLQDGHQYGDLLSVLLASEKALSHRISKLEKSPVPIPPETIDCDVCGCMVRKEKAVKGESRVERVLEDFYIMCPPRYKEWLVTPYLCKRCAGGEWGTDAMEFTKGFISGVKKARKKTKVKK